MKKKKAAKKSSKKPKAAPKKDQAMASPAPRIVHDGVDLDDALAGPENRLKTLLIVYGPPSSLTEQTYDLAKAEMNGDVQMPVMINVASTPPIAEVPTWFGSQEGRYVVLEADTRKERDRGQVTEFLGAAGQLLWLKIQQALGGIHPQ